MAAQMPEEFMKSAKDMTIGEAKPGTKAAVVAWDILISDTDRSTFINPKAHLHEKASPPLTFDIERLDEGVILTIPQTMPWNPNFAPQKKIPQGAIPVVEIRRG